MRKAGILLGTLIAGSLLLAACGGSGDQGAGGGTGAGGAGGAGGGTTGAGGSAPGCDAYCTDNLAACQGKNQQYQTKADCLGACAAFPPGVEDAEMGNSLACRVYHTGAAVMSSADVHCNHAGPGGGDQNPGDMSPGTCGEACEAYCQIASKVCTGSNAQYASSAECMDECKTFASSSDPFDVSDISKNDYNCRLYHVTAAAADPASHCSHIKADSPVCTQ